VNGYLNSRYRLPLVAVPDDLKHKTAALAGYILLQNRGFGPGEDAEQFTTMRDQAISWLREIVKGTVTPYGIKDSSEVDASADSAGEINRSGFVVQRVPGGSYADDGKRGFFGHTYETGDAFTNTPKRRGW
jgi:phage gp36-like protein